MILKKALILFFILSNNLILFSQIIKVKSWYTYYQKGDYKVKFKEFHSEEHYTKEGVEIYSLSVDSGYPDKSFCDFRYRIGETNNYMSGGRIEKSDTFRLIYYIHDTINSRNYIIDHHGDSTVFKAKYENGILIREDCLRGCKYHTLWSYNEFGKVDTFRIIDHENDTSYSIISYDEKQRPVIFKDMMFSKNDPHYLYTKTKYYDGRNYKIAFSGNSAHKDLFSIEILHYDEYLIPEKSIFIFYYEGIYTMRRYDYERIE